MIRAPSVLWIRPYFSVGKTDKSPCLSTIEGTARRTSPRDFDLFFSSFLFSLRAKGTLISEPRFSTPCEMRFSPREKGKTAFCWGFFFEKAVFPFSRGKNRISHGVENRGSLISLDGQNRQSPIASDFGSRTQIAALFAVWLYRSV